MPDEPTMRAVGAELAQRCRVGDVVCLHGDLGAGKTTFVRGWVAALGETEGVRSPTFNLIQVFETQPPVMHADLYRVHSAFGIGIEDYLRTHVCLIEWPENGADLLEDIPCWHVQIQFLEQGREVTVLPPE